MRSASHLSIEFPGWKRPGLIEAAILTERIRNLTEHHFRGGNAPASLKRYEIPDTIAKAAEFPGWKRPGLIEARLLLSTLLLLLPFPGWKRPGLIEA